ncbi:MAG: hypothetical protein B6245_08975 [Desulfobacteraceae bacterium 4572_88]|nr:MAG: hypothetical protein B6245_08975 [Desulfobacteraceae bacterium 4572_88]
MKRIIIFLLIIVAMAISACSGNNAEELFETAKFEELQNNQEHAGQLYQEIIEKYPETSYAKKARERLSAFKNKK